MDRRRFFSIIPAMIALPTVCKIEPEKPKLFWAGTIIPRSKSWEDFDRLTRDHIIRSWKGGLAMTEVICH